MAVDFGGFGSGVDSDADCLLIDIPIGLPESLEDEVKRPDQQLRVRLQGKQSSVFNTPCRQAVYWIGYNKMDSFSEELLE